MRRKSLFAIAAIATAAAMVMPARSAYQPTVIGAGGNSCGTWTNEKNTPLRLEDEAWVVGYFSAVNRYAMGSDGFLTRTTDGRGLIAWMDNYCEANPLNQIEAGAAALVDELRRRNGPR